MNEFEGWLRQWFNTAKMVVKTPQDFFAATEPHEDIVPAMKFAVTSLVISGFLSGVILLLFSSAAPGAATATVFEPLIQAFSGLIGGTIGILIGAGILHLFVYLLGGGDYMKTLSVVSYVTSVQAFFGWIPVINIVAAFYGIYIQVRGVEEFHNFSTGRAVAAVLLPIVALLVLGIGAAIIALSAGIIPQTAVTP